MLCLQQQLDNATISINKLDTVKRTKTSTDWYASVKAGIVNTVQCKAKLMTGVQSHDVDMVLSWRFIIFKLEMQLRASS